MMTTNFDINLNSVRVANTFFVYIYLSFKLYYISGFKLI